MRPNGGSEMKKSALFLALGASCLFISPAYAQSADKPVAELGGYAVLSLPKGKHPDGGR
jgi:hypothetical protein